MEQPEALMDTIRGRAQFEPPGIDLEDVHLSDEQIRSIDRVLLVGMGTSLHAAMVGRLYMEQIAGIHAEYDNASELRYCSPVLDERTLMIAVTQSGETVDTLAAMEEGRAHKTPQITITNVPGSEASRVADGVVYTRCGLEIGIASTLTAVWVGGVDWYGYEQVEYLADATDDVAENFGWPCYQGPEIQLGFFQRRLDSCRTLHQSDVTFPYYSYASQHEVVPGDQCGTERSSISGLAFYEGGDYPAMYRGALFFEDYSRACIWVMLPGQDGRLDPATTALFLWIPEPQGTDAGGPVDIEAGPGRDLFYVDCLNGGLHRIRHFEGDEPPIAKATATPTYGALPLTVSFKGSHSRDPDVGDTLRYAWDLDGDGAFDDSRQANPRFTYHHAGRVEALLRVTDSHVEDVRGADPLAGNDEGQTARDGIERGCHLSRAKNQGFVRRQAP